jgi:hypothetical protein
VPGLLFVPHERLLSRKANVGRWPVCPVLREAMGMGDSDGQVSGILTTARRITCKVRSATQDLAATTDTDR